MDFAEAVATWQVTRKHSGNWTANRDLARDLAKAIAVWRLTRNLARHQVILTKCPCCFAEGAEFQFDSCKYPGFPVVARGLRKGHYCLCHQCGVVFSAARPVPEAAHRFYDLLFKEGELDDDPTGVDARGVDRHLIKLLQQRDVLRPGAAILHLRCDTGALLQILRKLVPDATLHGLEYSDSYVRFLCDEGLGAAKLNPGHIELPFGVKYDLVLANHQLTHAIDPRDLLYRLCGVLNVGGNILFYNEIDHDRELDPGNEHYRGSDIVAFHKQLFNQHSFERLLNEAGLDYEYLGHQSAKMMYLARPSSASAHRAVIAPETIERQRQQIRTWQEAMRSQKDHKRLQRNAKSLRFIRKGLQRNLQGLQRNLRSITRPIRKSGRLITLLPRVAASRVWTWLSR